VQDVEAGVILKFILRKFGIMGCIELAQVKSSLSFVAGCFYLCSHYFEELIVFLFLLQAT
jgi:hypothetical protein